jgi:CRP-like cAMP-binding protein
MKRDITPHPAWRLCVGAHSGEIFLAEGNVPPGRSGRNTKSCMSVDVYQRPIYRDGVSEVRWEKSVELHVGGLSALGCLLTKNPAQNPLHNRLLAALPADVYQLIARDLIFTPLALGEQVYAAGQQLKSVYFPTTAVISLIHTMGNGRSSEIGLVGNDGVLGVALFMGGDSVANHAVVQSAGGSFRLSANAVASEFAKGEIFQRLMLRYAQALSAQMAQTTACNRHHSVEQQLRRWLLLSHDRLPSSQLNMTQELIATILGVRREAVSRQATKLRNAGLIKYHRGQITILDRAGLEAGACECYEAVRRETDRLMKDVL